MHCAYQFRSKKRGLSNRVLCELVEVYHKDYGDSYEQEDRWWGDQSMDWEMAIRRAWSSRFADGKMHGHQYRVARHLIEGLKATLDGNTKPSDLKNFHDIYSWIKVITNRVYGLGPTTAYDVARRLGVWLGFEPSMVYLHAGATVGARKFGITGEAVEIHRFPREIQGLGATHAENFLCIYKDLLPGS